MFIFIFFTTLFGIAHLYFFFRFTELVSATTPAAAVIGAATVIMALSPVIIHIGSFRLPLRTLRLMAAVSYSWIPYIIIFFPAAVCLEAYNLVAEGLLDFQRIPESGIFGTATALAVLLVAYGYYEAGKPVLERVRIETDKLPPHRSRIRILQISDLHIGISTTDDGIRTIMQTAEAENPDLIVSTGDLVDGVIRVSEHFAGELRRMKARIGRFAVLGNHEYYGGIRRSIKFIEDSGFRLLRGEAVIIEDLLYVAGVDDIINSRRSNGGDSMMSEDELLKGAGEGMYVLLLKHRSDVEAESCGRFDLQLSGHTHKGQMFPVNLATMWIFKHHSGLFRLPEGSMLYVSRGAGTAGPPVRLFSRPEITVIDIVRRDAHHEKEGDGYEGEDKQEHAFAC